MSRELGEPGELSDVFERYYRGEVEAGVIIEVVSRKVKGLVVGGDVLGGRVTDEVLEMYYEGRIEAGDVMRMARGEE